MGPACSQHTRQCMSHPGLLKQKFAKTEAQGRSALPGCGVSPLKPFLPLLLAACGGDKEEKNCCGGTWGLATRTPRQRADRPLQSPFSSWLRWRERPFRKFRCCNATALLQAIFMRNEYLVHGEQATVEKNQMS